MRTSLASLLSIAAALPAGVVAHYNFEALIVNGDVTAPYEYVRQTTNSNSPVEDVTSKDLVCNQGGLDASIRAKTKTHSVLPGDEVGFTVNVEIGHPGPLAVYMSKAPDGTETSDYLGDGDWFKVYELTTSDINESGLQWATYINNQGIHNFTFTLPNQLPPGNYLMRAEHVGLHGAGQPKGAQFYIGCAQLAVGGSGSGSPSPVVQFPGAYDGSEPGLLINLYYPAPTSYTAPGPVTWPNACEDHTANLNGQASDGDCTGSNASGGGNGSNNGGNGAGSGSSSTRIAVSSSAIATPVPSASVPSSVAVSQPATTAIPTTPVVQSPVSSAVATSGRQGQPTPVSSKAATPTKAPSDCSAARRKARKARRAAKRAAKKSNSRA